MQIFITDWWLCPELYLRRPFQVHRSSRLDTLLEAKAKQGVKVLIVFVIIPMQFTVLLSYPLIHHDLLHDLRIAWLLNFLIEFERSLVLYYDGVQTSDQPKLHRCANLKAA